MKSSALHLIERVQAFSDLDLSSVSGRLQQRIKQISLFFKKPHYRLSLMNPGSGIEDEFGDFEEGGKEKRCKNCRRTIYLSEDLLITEKAVLGQRGPIPLGGICCFCSDECVGLYFGGLPSEDLPKVPPKIP